MPFNTILRNAFTSLFSILLFTCIAHANGAAFNPGVASAPPRPVQQSDLYLNKEEVLFKDGKVSATFWVKNPSSTDISTGMGFPLEYKKNGRNRNYYIEDLHKDFSVYVNGQLISAHLSNNLDGDYPVIILWDMIYPANQETIFKVEYPMLPMSSGFDDPGMGSSEEWRFEYITHTGAYWARPISSAVFKFCGRNQGIFSLAQKYPKGSYEEWSEDGWDYENGSIKISPKPYKLDEATQCIVWERNDWKPQKGKDDIYVSVRHKSEGYKYPWGYSNNWQGYNTDPENYHYVLMEHWCGGENNKNNKGHLSQKVDLNTNSFSESEFIELTKKSYKYLNGTEEECNGDYCDPFYSLPTHLKTDYQLYLLRYFRNSIVAKYGYQFKDENLRNCFDNITPVDGQLTQTEIQTIEAIKKKELEINSINEFSWKKVRNK